MPASTGSNLKGSVTVETTSAANALAALANRYRTLATNSNTTNKSLKDQAVAMNALASAAEKEARSLARVAVEQAKVNKAAAEANLIKAKTSGVRSDTAGRAAESTGRQALLDAKAQTEEVRRRIMLEEQAARTKARADAEARRAAQELLKLEREKQRAIEQQYQSLTSLRYAMYDVASSARNISLALGAAAIVPVAVAVSWERAFANVERTVGGSQEEIKNLRAGLVDLAQTIPSTFGQIAEIGTLAGQLGIQQKDIVSFTKVVAMFGATTDVSINDAATAFGRINSLIPSVQGNYEGVADAILNVGVNSVATESQIVRITTQISALASTTSFTYDQIVGLAGALASVGVPPELSRGVTTRVFGQIGRAISEGGVALEKFGYLAGMSGREFAKAWSEDAGSTFLRFMQGIQREGQGAESAIRGLGITSVRDVPILIRLANAADSAGKSGGLLAQTMKDAANSSGTLGAQYGIIADTISSKLVVLTNNVQAFMDSAAVGTLGPIGVALDIVTGALKNLTDLTSNDVGMWIFGIGIAITGLTSLLGLMLTAVLAGVAGYAALITALRSMTLASNGAGVSLVSMNALLAATGPLGAKAAAAIRLVGFAMKTLAGIGLLVAGITIIPEVTDAGQKWADDIRGIDRALLPTLKRLEEFRGKGLNTLGQTIKELGIGRVMNFNSGLDDTAKDLRNLNERFKELASNGEARTLFTELKLTSDALGMSTQDLVKQFPGLSQAISDAGLKVTYLADGGVEVTNSLTGASEAVRQLSEDEIAAEAAHTELIETYAAGLQTFGDLKGAYTSVVEANKAWAESTAEASGIAGDSWKNYYDGFSVNVDSYLAELQRQVDAQNNWEANILTLQSRGVAQSVIDELVKMGVDAAPLVQSFVDDTTGKINQLEPLFSELVGDGLTAGATTLTEASPAFWEAVEALGAGAKQEIINALASGKSDVQGIIDEYGLIVEGFDPPVKINTGPAYSELDTFERQLALRRFEALVVARVEESSLAALRARIGTTVGIALPKADGGVVDYYANGGIRERHVAQIAPAGANRVWAERETGGESYIPLALSKRNRSLDIWAETGRRLGVTGYANGAVVAGQARTGTSGSSLSVVELGAYERDLLMAIASRVGITIDAGALGRANGVFNMENSRRGTN